MKKRILHGIFRKILALFSGIIVFAAILYSGIQCPFKYVLHFDCPGCGMTRAILCLFRLDFAAAFHYHPMVFALPVLFLYFLTDGTLFENRYVNTAVLALIAAGFIVCYIAKLIIFL